MSHTIDMIGALFEIATHVVNYLTMSSQLDALSRKNKTKCKCRFCGKSCFVKINGDPYKHKCLNNKYQMMSKSVSNVTA